MDEDCVPEAEMHWIGAQPDPIDAVLDEEGTRGEDLLAVALVVHDLRSAYERTEPLELHPELAELIGVHLDSAHDPAAGSELPAGSGGAVQDEPSRRKPSSMLRALGAFAATLTGKVALGAAVATASVGGLHTADVVDVPILPDAKPAVDRPDPPDPADTIPTERATAGEDTADANRSAAAAYTDAVDEWTNCVAGAAAGRGDEETRTTGEFDPREGCGDQPRPADYGLGELPDQAADAAQDARDNVPPGAQADPASPGPRGSDDTTPATPNSTDSTNPGRGTPAPETPAPEGPDATLPPQAGTAPGGGADTPAGGRP